MKLLKPCATCGKRLCWSCPAPEAVNVHRRYFLQAGLLVPVAASVTVAPAVKLFDSVTWRFTNGSQVDFGGTIGQYRWGSSDGGVGPWLPIEAYVIPYPAVYGPGLYKSLAGLVDHHVDVVGGGTPKGGG